MDLIKKNFLFLFLYMLKDVRDDVAGAQAVGIRGYLVQTGKYRQDDENKISPLPYKVCSSFVEAVQAIMEEIV